jgi:membrane protein DedA with SNARE-associated domain
MPMFDGLSQLLQYYPLFAFIALLLAGLNLPFSEDLIIITGAIVCQADPSLLAPCIIAIYAGISISDFMSYFIGKFIKKGAISWFNGEAFFNHKYIDIIHRNIEKHGPWTFIVCRFIPFGIRNALFMTSGFFGLSLKRFALYDIVASLISMNTLFWLVFCFGDVVEKPIKVVGYALFAILCVGVLTLIIRFIVHIKKVKERKKQHQLEAQS